MLGVLTGYAIISFVILVGYLVERTGVLGRDASLTLNKFVFYVATPALLFTVLATSDIKILFSDQLIVGVTSLLGTFGVYVLIVAVVFRRKIVELILGASSASYVNSNNIGLPVAIYMLGSAEYAAPILMLQVVIMTPILLTILDLTTAGKLSWKKILLQPITNPVIVASLLGISVALLDLKLPSLILEPLQLIGGAAIPTILIVFGMSLQGRKPMEAGSPKAEIVIASVLKTILMPAIAWFVGSYLIGITGNDLYAAVVMAALPTAQNVFTYATKYNRSVIMVRDTVLITTIAAFPVLLLISLVLA